MSMRTEHAERRLVLLQEYEAAMLDRDRANLEAFTAKRRVRQADRRVQEAVDALEAAGVTPRRTLTLKPSERQRLKTEVAE